jgi:hypothetical protein
MIRRGGLALACILASVLPVAAQGNGHGHAYGLLKSAAPTPSSGGAAQVQPAVAGGVRNFGSWLDDASIMTPGSGSLTMSFAWFRAPAYHEFDAPIGDGAIGLTSRVQFGFSVPYYHVNAPGGPVVRGIGDLYLTSKVQLLEPSAQHNGFGLAVVPIVTVLSGEADIERRRVSWGAPIAMELQKDGWRVFGTAGYFSQGSIFASGALEVQASQRLTITGTLTQSHSTIDDPPGMTRVLNRTRTDVSGSGTWMMRPGLAFFGSVGRTISQQDANAASLVLSGGVSFAFDAWQPVARK